MAEKRIVWHENAIVDLKSICDYFNKRNGSRKYSTKLVSEIKEILILVSENIELGIKTTTFNYIRAIIKDNYKIFYQIKTTEIEILSIWDCRQNPEKNKFL